MKQLIMLIISAIPIICSAADYCDEAADLYISCAKVGSKSKTSEECVDKCAPLMKSLEKKHAIKPTFDSGMFWAIVVTGGCTDGFKNREKASKDDIKQMCSTN